MTEVTEVCNSENPEIFMTRELWRQIVALFRQVYDEHSSEVVVWLVSNKNDPYRVIDFYVPEQEVSGAACETKDEENYDRYFLKIWREENDKIVCGSMHSHGNMTTFHSGTDDQDVENQAYINLNENLPFVDITSNIKGECKARVSMKKGCGEIITKDVDEITFPDMEEFELPDFAEVIKKVKKKTFSYSGGYQTGSKSYYDIPYEIREAVDGVGKYPMSVICEAMSDLTTDLKGSEKQELIVRLACALYKMQDAEVLEEALKDLDFEDARKDVNDRQRRTGQTNMTRFGTYNSGFDPWDGYADSLDPYHFRSGVEVPDEDHIEEEIVEVLERMNNPKEKDPKGRNPHVG